jgi:hypothetical protein
LPAPPLFFHCSNSSSGIVSDRGNGWEYWRKKDDIRWRENVITYYVFFQLPSECFFHQYIFKFRMSISLSISNLYYYIKHLRIGGFIFCHGNFLLYPFYPSIRWIIFIFGWSNVCDRVHWSPLSLHFFPTYTIISIILLFLFSNLVHIW